MKIRKLGAKAVITCILLCLMFPGVAYASDGEDYITISVAATDDNEQLQYALDTDDPSAFSDSNEFAIPAGTSHTIYVKDVAGNITSQTYHPDPNDSDDTDEQKINIDLEIGGNKPDYSNYEYLTDDPIEPGTGTVAEKINTDASDNAERVFYTVTTKEGEVLYMVIDQSRSSDNVYLLDTVSVSDLLALADGNGSTSSTEKEDNLLSALAKEDNLVETETETKTTEKESSGTNPLMIFVILALVAGVYYYFKIYKNKKDESMDMVDDAMDMDEFEAEEDDEVEFEIDDAEKERFLEELINGEEENPDLLDADPDEYAKPEGSGEDESEYGDFFDDENLEEGF